MFVLFTYLLDCDDVSLRNKKMIKLLMENKAKEIKVKDVAF